MAALTVGRGGVPVPVISPEEHVEGEIRDVVALPDKDRDTSSLFFKEKSFLIIQFTSLV